MIVRIAAWTLLVLIVVAGAGCATTKKGEIKLLESTLRAHGSTMRWGQIDQALAYMDPKFLEKHKPTELELERWRQVRVAGYREQPFVLTDETHAVQVVEVEVINNHTQAVRSVVDRQEWRFDEENERWLLTTGLPKLVE